MNRKAPHAHIGKANLILAEIRMCHVEEGQDPSYLDMMTDIVISPKTISKILRRLQAFGNLRIERRAGRRNHYILQEKNK
jgi:DNA-binding transcriptional regulator YhcF (GntR family)